MTATIRNGVQSDLEALIAIDDIASSNEARRTQIRDGLLESGIAVAVVDAAPAGYALLTYHFFGQAFLELVYVGAEYRRCGIGSALIRHVLEKTGGSKLFTSTNQSNAPMRAACQAGVRGIGYHTQPRSRRPGVDLLLESRQNGLRACGLTRRSQPMRRPSPIWRSHRPHSPTTPGRSSSASSRRRQSGSRR